ncbi:MAG: DNA mismatch repair endonuclease MutL [Bacilli bacterium]
MSKIQVMDEILANKIAAGEVVERCASVVKELVENSIDANSNEIKVELIEAGTKEIKVTDNGSGMDKEDAILSFGRHATSKLKTEHDLFSINTLGFRGEALAAISSVSEIELITSTGEIGTIVNIKGGKISEVKAGDLRRGTIITVKNLFYNTPARLKHLKSLYTELANIVEYIDKLALSHPDIKFTLINNNSVVVSTDGTNNLLKTIKNIYGVEVAKKMLLVNSTNDDYEIDGYISLPEINRSSRNHMITLVNGRVVKNTEICRVINDSYHSFKPDTRYPIVVLNLKADPSLVDVNIHPTKMDIRFSKIEELSLTIEEMIKNKIRKINLIPEIKETIKEPESPKYQYQTLELNRINETTELYGNKDFLVKRDIESIETNNIENNYQELEKKERLPELYPVGLVHGTYIICQNELGMYLIDQHAAKERINYETFKEKLGNPHVSSIELLFPITLELPTNEYIILKENLHILTNMAFLIEEFGISSIIIKRHPTWLPKGYEEQAIRKIIEVIIQEEKNFSIVKFNEKIATMLSCKLAIKANENITIKEMEQLINDLRACDNPFNCPHGRPTTIFYSNYELEKLFKRSGF